MEQKAGQGLLESRFLQIIFSIVFSAALAWLLLGRSERRRVSEGQLPTKVDGSLTSVQAERQFAAEKGCLPPKTWNSTWPLGLDMLAKAAKYARTMQILQFFLDVVDDNGTTFVQELLGAAGIDTVDPENIEAVLSTNFEGTSKAVLTRGSSKLINDQNV